MVVLAYFLGPQPDSPNYTESLPIISTKLEQLEEDILRAEAQLNLREDNGSSIIWANDSASETEYAFLYLHGFSASPHEGYPVHQMLADTFASNLFLPRLAAHGFKNDQLEGFTAERLYESAVNALATAQLMGEKVILVSTSTGGTLALKLAAEFPESVHALITYSPHIRIKNPAAVLLNDPWGLQLAQLTFGGKKRRIEHEEPAAPQYWDTLYTARATVQLQELLETTMHENTFEKVNCPSLTLYYFKDQQHQDDVIDVSVIPPMHGALGTPDSLKEIRALPSPGDHVIASDIKSDNWEVVLRESIQFCRETLGLTLAHQ